jgi:hypothetical protein
VYATRDNGSGTGDDFIEIQINGDTTANYDNEYIVVHGGGAASATENLNNVHILAGLMTQGGLTAGIFASGDMRLTNYANTNMTKNLMARCSSQTASHIGMFQGTGFWKTTNAAITSITIKPANNQFAAGCTFQTYLIP